MFVARNSVFLEKEFLSRGVSGSTVHIEEVREDPSRGISATALEAEPVVVPMPTSAPEPRRSTRLQSARDVLLLDSDEPARGDSGKALEAEPVMVPMPTSAPELRRSARFQSACDVLLLDSDEPASYSEAMVGSDSESWLGAMRSEIKSMDENQVWNLVDLPDDERPVECKWISELEHSL